MYSAFSKYQVMEKIQRSVLHAYQNYSFQFYKTTVLAWECLNYRNSYSLEYLWTVFLSL